MGDFGLLLILISVRGGLKHGNRNKLRNMVYFYYKISELKN